MAPLCYRRHRFPPEIIQHAIWLYLRFTLSYRDVEDTSGRTRARYLLRNGAPMGAEVRPRDRATAAPASPSASDRWHLDESAPRTHDQQRECGAA